MATEKKPVGTEEEIEEEIEKKPTKKPAKKAEEKEEKKPNFLVRIGRCIKRRKNEIIAGVVGAVVGSATTYGVGEIGKRVAAKRNSQQFDEMPNE